MNTTAGRRPRTTLLAGLASVVGVLGLLGLLVGPATAQVSGGATATGDSVGSGTCTATSGSVCSGSGLAASGSTSSGSAVASGGSVSSGCATATNLSTASGGPCPPLVVVTITLPPTPRTLGPATPTGGSLALTGSNTGVLASTALLVMLAGAVLVFIAARRPADASF